MRKTKMEQPKLERGRSIQQGTEAEKSAAKVKSLTLECPVELPPRAQEEWQRIVGELIALRVLSKFDLAMLALYCVAYAGWIEATVAIQEYGAIIKTPNGYPVQSPYVTIQKNNADLMVQIAKEFGFTPASRSRNFSYEKSRRMLIVDQEDSPSELKPL